MHWTFLFALFVFTGCALPWANPQTLPSQETPQYKSQKIETEKRELQTQATKPTGYIKGVIQSISWDEASKRWVYDVAGVDTKNGKLSQAIFTHTQKLYDIGSLIYAQIKEGVLVDMYRVSGNQLLPTSLNKPAPINMNESPTQKRTKNRQKISPPQEETIRLE